MCWNAFERLSIFGPPSHVLLPPAEAEKHKMSGENRAGLCHPYILTHTHTYATTHLLTGLLTVRLLSQCPRRGRCPFIWTKPERGDSLDLISKLLHQFISIHTTEQPRALPPTPHQQLSSSFRNLCPNAASGKKKKKEKAWPNHSDGTFLLSHWKVPLLLWQVSLFFPSVLVGSFSLHFC